MTTLKTFGAGELGPRLERKYPYGYMPKQPFFQYDIMVMLRSTSPPPPLPSLSSHQNNIGSVVLMGFIFILL